jgi:hypothetical protein
MRPATKKSSKLVAGGFGHLELETLHDEGAGQHSIAHRQGRADEKDRRPDGRRACAELLKQYLGWFDRQRGTERSCMTEERGLRGHALLLQRFDPVVR